MSRTSAASRLIKERGAELGIDGIGVCDASPLDETRAAFEAAIARGLIPESDAPSEGTLARLTTPGLHLRGARSIVSAYQSYPAGEPPGIDLRHGVIAPYTRANYYMDLKVRLEHLAALMRSEFGCRTKVFSCYVTLAEKPIARRAGLGFYGKNGVILTRRHGSFVVLGEIITDLEIDPDPPLNLDCGSCRLCMDACPTGAIPSPHMVDRKRCIQYLSERRGVISLDVREAWRNRLYGCSTCQDVCPRNLDPPTVTHEAPYGRVGSAIALEEMLAMEDGSFMERFRDNQIGMREPAVLRRNAIVAAGNSGEKAFLPLLLTLAQDPDPMLRRNSLWAVWKIQGPVSDAELRSALDAEIVPEIAAELKTLLDGFHGMS